MSQSAAATAAAIRYQAQMGYSQDIQRGISPADAMAKWGPLIYMDDPAGLADALALARATETPPASRFSPGEPADESREAASGTGFFVSDDGYLVTCAHVVRHRSSFRVRTALSTRAARLIATDSILDIAVLKVGIVSQALPIAPEPRVRLGDEVFTIGFPNPDLQGINPKLTRGEISSMAGVQDNPRYFQISVPVQPGNSGGALVDESGSVVGVVTARLDDVATYQTSGALPQNVNYAVKGSLVREFLNTVPGLAGKLKPACTAKDREAASAAAERAAALVIAE
jgi:serine protease Do